MKRLILNIILLITLNMLGFSQDEPQLPEITPPSPTAYELGKYGQIPVGEFTGTPNVNIPLYEYKTRNLSVPISLSYSSNGIKVDQMETNVGLGWSLNVGGVVTRIIRDQPDELNDVFFPEEELNNVALNSPTAIDYFELVLQNTADSETDLYMYNFNGYSGKMVFKKNRVPLLIPHNNLKVEVIQNGTIQGFYITTPDGIKYEFTEVETSTSRLRTSAGHQPPGPTAPSAWYLTKIVHPLGDEIYFSYVPFSKSYTTSQSQSLKVPHSNIMPTCSGAPPALDGYEESPVANHDLTISGKAIQTISSNVPATGTITFNGSQKVSSIVVKDEQNTIIENFNFNYLTTSNLRTFLTSIQYKDPKKQYAFEYVDTAGLVERLSFSQDHWGYYNGANNLHLFPNPQSLELVNSLSYHDIGANKEPNSAFAEKGLLKKIIYPTKGHTLIEYEGNNYPGTETVYPGITSESMSINTDIDHHSGDVIESRILNNIKLDQVAPVGLSIKINPSSDSGCNVYEDDDMPIDDTHMKIFIRATDLTNPSNNNIFSYRTQFGDWGIGNSFDFKFDDENQYHMHLKKDHEYEISIKVSWECVSASLRVDYMQGDIQEVPVVKPLGGVRVKRTTDYSSATEKANETRYYYGKKESKDVSTAEKGVIPYYISKQTTRHSCDGGDNAIPCTYVDHKYNILNSSSTRTLYRSVNNSTIYYNYVTASFGGDNFENGGIEKEFIVNNDTPGNPIWGEVIQSAAWNNNGWSNGFEKKATTFKKDINNNIVVLNEVENTYKKDDRYQDDVSGYSFKENYNLICLNYINYSCTTEDVTKTYIRKNCTTSHNHIWEIFSDHTRCIAPNANNVDIVTLHACYGKPGATIRRPDLLENLSIMKYKTYSYWHYLKSTTEKTYDENGQNPITQTTNYYYDNVNHLNPTRTETTTSDGNQTEVKMYYPDDVDDLTGLSQVQIDAIDRLKKDDLCQPATPIQNEIYKKSADGVNTLLSTQRTIFKDFTNDVVMPSVIQAAKGTNGLEDEVLFESYYPNGNIQQVSKDDGMKIVYIWGYNKTRVIAKIENAIFAQIPTATYNIIISASNADNDRTLGNAGDEGALRTALNSLRSDLPDAMITTFTYDPLIGTTSVTKWNNPILRV